MAIDTLQGASHHDLVCDDVAAESFSMSSRSEVLDLGTGFPAQPRRASHRSREVMLVTSDKT